MCYFFLLKNYKIEFTHKKQRRPLQIQILILTPFQIKTQFAICNLRGSQTHERGGLNRPKLSRRDVATLYWRYLLPTSCRAFFSKQQPLPWWPPSSSRITSLFLPPPILGITLCPMVVQPNSFLDLVYHLTFDSLIRSM